MAISDNKHGDLDLIKKEGEYYSLHCHSEYSYKDGLSKPDDIAKRSLELGNDAFCLTEHGNLASLIQGFKAQSKHKIQFIPGMEIYLIPESKYWDFNKKKRIEDGEEIEDIAVRYHHLTLIAKNQNGLQNLIKIYNRKEMHYGNECISRDTLFEYGDDLIVLSGCIAGETIYFIRNNMNDKAKEILQLYKDRFNDDFYIEIQYHGLDLGNNSISELEVYNTLVTLSRELDIKMVPTTDSHYTYKNEVGHHNLYKCMHYDGKDKDKFKYNFETQSFKSVFNGDGYHIMSAEEIKEQISSITSLSKENINDIVKNTIEIRNKCEVCYFPEAMPLQDKSKELRELVEKGFQELRAGTEYEKESKERYEFELSVIEKLGFTEYFINVRDIVNRAKQLNILPGPARGSAAGSEVCYLIHITKVDPLKFGLMFERFLNPSRFNYPDIDLDFQSDKNGLLGKELVIDSLGKDKFKFYGHILNESRSSTIILFKSLARLFKISPFEANKVTTDEESKTKYLIEKEYTNWLPGHLEKLGIPFTEEWREFEKYIDFCYIYGGQSHGDKSEGVLWNTAIHASGVIFYPTNNLDVLPKNDDGIIYKGHDLEEMGYIKYDILSVDGLNIVNEFMNKIEKDTGKPFDWQDTFDKKTWDVFKEADTDFVFQFSSPGMKRLLKNVKPGNVSDLAELNALYRPGAIGAGILDRYIKNEYEPYELVVGNFLKKYFGEEHSNAMIFQEDIMKIVEKMAGFSLAEADMVRRAMQRKEPETLARYKGQFLENFNKEEWAPDYDEDVDGPLAEQIWNSIEEFAAYTFNKSHSVAYGLIAYWTAYIFKHYKNDMLKYLLDSGKNKQEVIKYLSKDHKIIYPSLETQNKDYIVTDDEVFLPTIIDYDPNENFAHYILNLDTDKNKMIKKQGIFDNICIDRKGLVNLGKAIPKKKKELLNEIYLENLKTNNINEFIEKLSVLDVLDYERGKGHLLLKVHKARSDEEIELRTSLDEETLFHNAQEDIRTFGLPRDIYADQAPEINFDNVVTRVEDYYSDNIEDNPALTKDWLLKKYIEADKTINAISSREYNVICTDKKITGNYGSAEIAFNNDVMFLGIKNKKATEMFKTFKKNTPVTIKLKPNFFINKDNEIDYRLNIVDAWEREF